MTDRIGELIELFLEDNGAPTSTEVVPPEAFQKYRGVLPNCLLDLWKRHGWAGYGNGRWWLVNPERLEVAVADWLDGSPLQDVDRFHCFARSGFGKLHVWGEKLGNMLTIDCSIGYIVALKEEVGVPEKEPELALATRLSFLTPDAADIEGDDGEMLFDAAVARLGPLQPTEVFGFEPALILGGPASADHLRKQRMDVHLSLLRQFGPAQVPGF